MIKKGLLQLSALAMLLILAACSNSINDNSATNVGNTSSPAPSSTPVQTTEQPSSEPNPSPTSSASTSSTSDAEGIKISLKFMDEEVIVTIFDHPTSQDFLSRLPLSLTFEEFGGFEKMSILDEGLSTEEAAEGYTPEAGDFAYYAPWKDITIFYADWKYSPGLVKLGEVESGVEELSEKLKNIGEDFTIEIEKVD